MATMTMGGKEREMAENARQWEALVLEDKPLYFGFYLFIYLT